MLHANRYLVEGGVQHAVQCTAMLAEVFLQVKCRRQKSKERRVSALSLVLQAPMRACEAFARQLHKQNGQHILRLVRECTAGGSLWQQLLGVRLPRWQGCAQTAAGDRLQHFTAHMQSSKVQLGKSSSCSCTVNLQPQSSELQCSGAHALVGYLQWPKELCSACAAT